MNIEKINVKMREREEDTKKRKEREERETTCMPMQCISPQKDFAVMPSVQLN